MVARSSKPLTDEEAAEMEAHLMEHRGAQMRAQRAQMTEEAKPLIDFAKLPALQEIEEAVEPLLDMAMQDRKKFPDLHIHLYAIQKGLEGFRAWTNSRYGDLLAPAPEAEAPTA